MGNYVFTTEALMDVVTEDAKDETSNHDIGGNLIPMLVARGEARVYDFAANHVPGATDRDSGYWRDVGTLDAYYDAHMDLISVTPIFNLYNLQWPILTWLDPLPPAKFVFDEDGRRATRSTRWCARGSCCPAASRGARSCRRASTCTPTPRSRTRS